MEWGFLFFSETFLGTEHAFTHFQLALKLFWTMPCVLIWLLISYEGIVLLETYVLPFNLAFFYRINPINFKIQPA